MTSLQLPWAGLEKTLSYLKSVNISGSGHSVNFNELKEYITMVTMAVLRCKTSKKPGGDKMNFNDWNSLMHHFVALAKNGKVDLQIKSNSLLTAAFIFTSVPQVSNLYLRCI